MAKYEIISSNLKIGNAGEMVDEAALVGCNITALVDAGHIKPATISKFSKKQDKESEEQE